MATATKKKPRKTLLDLDALAREPMTIILDGKEHRLIANTLDNFAKATELQKLVKEASDKQDPAALRDGMEALLGFLAPTLTRAQIGALEDPQMAALVDVWVTQSVADAEEADTDTKAVVEHPTSPG